MQKSNKSECKSHYAKQTVKSNPNRIIIRCGINNLKMDESLEAISKQTIELAKSVKSTANVVVISSIIPHRRKLDVKGSKVNNIVEHFFKEDKTIKIMWQKSFDSEKHIGKDGINLNNFGIT